MVTRQFQDKFACCALPSCSGYMLPPSAFDRLEGLERLAQSEADCETLQSGSAGFDPSLTGFLTLSGVPCSFELAPPGRHPRRDRWSTWAESAGPQSTIVDCNRQCTLRRRGLWDPLAGRLRVGTGVRRGSRGLSHIRSTYSRHRDRQRTKSSCLSSIELVLCDHSQLGQRVRPPQLASVVLSRMFEKVPETCGSLK
jgi:hypothetical protein